MRVDTARVVTIAAARPGSALPRRLVELASEAFYGHLVPTSRHRRQLVIVGTGGYGRELLDVVEAVNAATSDQATYQLVGFLAEEPRGRLLDGARASPDERPSLDERPAPDERLTRNNFV